MDIFNFEQNLVKRFLSDCDIPIKTVSREIFLKQLAEFGYMDKWKEFVDMINNDFFGEGKNFLDYFYLKREEIINALKNKKYDEFNSCDMNRFAFPQKFHGVSKCVWQSQNSGGTFVSFDLRKANFQALRFVDKDIVLGYDSWDAFCRKFTDCEYIINSKYFRQVVFGQLNPGRHTTVEKHMMGLVYDYLEHHGIIGGLIDRKLFELCAVSVDELVFRVHEPIASTFVSSELYKSIVDAIMDTYGFEIKATVFNVDAYHLVANMTPDSSGRDVCQFFVKTDLVNKTKELMCVPQTYYAITTKLAKGCEVENTDKHFVYEGLDCMFNEDFKIIDTSDNIVTNII